MGLVKEARCDVCKQPVSMSDDVILADNYTRQIIDTLAIDFEDDQDGLLASGQGPLVNAVTMEYFRQFEKRYAQKYGDVVELGEVMRDRLIDEKAHKNRLEKVLENPPKRFLFLLAHGKCVPPEYTPANYEIELNRIDTAEKALEWTFHLEEKNWFNARGWVYTLGKLFERIHC